MSREINSEKNTSPRWRIYDGAAELAEAAAQRISEAAREAIQARGQFKLVLAGGRTPEQVYRLLAGRAEDWRQWQIYFGDERCLPTDHPERNSRMAELAWLGQVPIPLAQIHPIPAEMCPATAARRYSGLIQNVMPFDLVLLGLGEDGHTASLFPDAPAADSAQEALAAHWALAVYHAPKPPAQRVSLSAAALSNTRALLVLVSGESKRDAVRRWQQGEPLPVASLHPPHGPEVLLDQAAWPDR